jgi:hypothetical protein
MAIGKNIALSVLLSALAAGSITSNYADAQTKGKAKAKAKHEQILPKEALMAETPQLLTFLEQYVFHDRHGMYCMIKADPEASEDFYSPYFSQSRNEPKNLNNLGTVLNAILYPAITQHPQNREGGCAYPNVNEIRGDVLKRPYDELNLTERIFRYNYDNQQKLGITVGNNPDVVEHLSRWYLPLDILNDFYSAAQLLSLKTGLSDELEKSKNAQIAEAVVKERDRLEQKISELGDAIDALRRKNSWLSDKVNKFTDYLSNMGVWPTGGITIRENEIGANYGLTAGLPQGFKVNFDYMPGKEISSQTSNTVVKPDECLDLDGYSEKISSSTRNYHGWTAGFGIPITSGFGINLNAGRINVDDNASNVSSTWFETQDGRKVDFQQTPYHQYSEKSSTIAGPGIYFEAGGLKIDGNALAGDGVSPVYLVKMGYDISRFWNKTNSK